MKNKLAPVVFFLSVLWFSGCSSAPSKPAEILINRDTALKQLNYASELANRGQYENALYIVEDARRLAVSTDDPALRVKTSTGRGNILFSLNRNDEAFNEWETAAAEADSSGLPVLAALARIYSIRASLLLLDGQADASARAEDLKTGLNRETAIVRSDSYSLAAANVTLGIAEKQLGRWTEAETALKRALNVHENDLSLEEAAYDWFLIASVRSMAGNYDSALDALRSAISFDRKAENGYGLASNWQAMGDVYQKAGRQNEATAAFSRAAEIFRAIGLGSRAEAIEKQSREN